MGESGIDDITVTKTGAAPPYSVTASGFLWDPSNVLTGTFDADNRLLLSSSYAEDGGTTTAEHDRSPQRSGGTGARIPVSKETVTSIQTPGATVTSCSLATGKGSPGSGTSV